MVTLLPEGRTLQLREEFAYIDPRRKVWVARKDDVVDGASIPRAFWSLIGGPLEGQYRNASIVHDVECDHKTQPWQDVHMMFYEACRCGGVPETKAKVIYFAVYHFGPRWELKTVEEEQWIQRPDGQFCSVKVRKTTSGVNYAAAATDLPDLEKLERFVAEQNPSLDALRAIDPNTLPR